MIWEKKEQFYIERHVFFKKSIFKLLSYLFSFPNLANIKQNKILRSRKHT